MSQKIHPLGFRVGITKKHQSQWFARFNRNKYSQTVLEDRMIRDTLNQLFPELLNPTLSSSSKGEKKRDPNSKVKKSRITQIKIERNIVPYQIGIQIHAENCQLLKSVIKNLQVKREIIVKLQKTRQYLTNLKTKLDHLTNNTSNTKETNTDQSFLQKNLKSSLSENSRNKITQIQVIKRKLAKMKGSLSRSPSTQFASQNALKLKVQKKSGTQLISKLLKIKLLKAKLSKLLQVKTKRRTSELEGQVLNSSTKPAGLLKKTSLKKRSSIISKIGSKLTKRQVKRQRTFKKRLRLRKFIRLRDRFLISKGLFIEKKENKIVKRISLVPTSRFLKDFSLNQSVNLLPVKQIEKMLNTKKVKTSNITSETNVTVGSQKRLKKVEPQILKTNLFNSRIRRKFVTIYIEQMKKRFLPHLNELFIKYTNNEPNSIRKGVSLGYLKKWDFNARVEILKTKPINQLERFVDNLREKFVQKLNLLRKEFITFGSFSSNSSEILGLFQFYNYLMSLKELVHDLKRNLKHKLKTRLAVSKISSSAFKKGSKETITELSVRANKLRVIESSNLLLQQKVSRKKLDQISNECRKMRFIEYLKDLVQKHRTDNIYLYLSSLSESRIKLKEIKNELKENLDFYLPGTNSIKDLIKARKTESSVENRNQLDSQINEQVNTVLLKLSKKNVFDKTFADCNFEDLERRKDMWLKNLKLIPQISIKFFSVNPTSLNQKASIVSEAVVDALEKRKAFRKVIKTTKEKLMRSPEIKGVKIQVAGRLNGAEIARAEWVRAGRVPLQTLRANLDYSYRTANTIYGIIGVKVWIFKGFTKLITKS